MQMSDREPEGNRDPVISVVFAQVDGLSADGQGMHAHDIVIKEQEQE